MNSLPSFPAHLLSSLGLLGLLSPALYLIPPFSRVTPWPPPPIPPFPSFLPITSPRPHSKHSSYSCSLLNCPACKAARLTAVEKRVKAPGLHPSVFQFRPSKGPVWLTSESPLLLPPSFPPSSPPSSSSPFSSTDNRVPTGTFFLSPRVCLQGCVEQEQVTVEQGVLESGVFRFPGRSNGKAGCVQVGL